MQSTTDSQHKVDNNGNQKENTQHGWTETVIVWTRTSHSNGLSSPVVGDQSIYHRQHGNECEQTRTDSADLVTEVQQTNTKRPQDHGEVQPRQEGSLIGEEDLWLDSSGQCNSLIGGHYGKRGEGKGRHLKRLWEYMTTMEAVSINFCLFQETTKSVAGKRSEGY